MIISAHKPVPVHAEIKMPCTS